MNKFLFLCLVFVSTFSSAQLSKHPMDKYKGMTEIGPAYVDIHFMGQIWARYTELNPGSTVNTTPKEGVFDVGLRRWRLSSKAFFKDERASIFTQFGQNNFSYKSTKYTGSFFHDAQFEYKIIKKRFQPKIDYITLGGGLFGWSGPSRFSSPSVGNLLAMDAPLYQQATNGISDQFLRKIGVYAKGEVSKLEYRFALTTPMTVTGVETTLNQNYSVYNPTATSLQPQGYVKFQVFEKESIGSAYAKSTYLGKKKILAFGLGFVQQNDAFWQKETNGDTSKTAMMQIGADVFFDSKMDSSRYGVTAYIAYHNYNFGKNYIRNVGVMNPATGTNDATIMNGSGNSFPTLGTGNSLFYQLALNVKRLKKMSPREIKTFLIHDHLGIAQEPIRYQFYTTGQLADYEGLGKSMYVFNIGVNYLPLGTQNMKFTLDYQNRPVYQGDVLSNNVITRKGMYTLQYQLSF